jgi:hypothetical protein
VTCQPRHRSAYTEGDAGEAAKIEVASATVVADLDRRIAQIDHESIRLTLR